MTRQTNDSVLQAATELLNENGFEAYAQVLQILLSEAVKIEREDVLNLQLYRRTDQRQGYANGYKPKTLDTRMGKITVDMRPVRDQVRFYPCALERGCRSERVLKVENPDLASDQTGIHRKHAT